MSSQSEQGLRFSVVVVNYNGGAETAEAIRSALREGVPPARVAVVDNGSAATMLEDLKRASPEVPFLENGCNAGFAKAVNRGLGALQSEFVVLLNNDAQLVPGALRAFADAFDAIPEMAIAGGQLRYPDGRLQSAFAPLPTLLQELIPVNFLKWAKPQRYLRVSSAEEITEVESVFGACLAVRSAAIKDFGLLDEDFFFYFEEVEWCFRARPAGWKVCYVPSARVIHLMGATAKKHGKGARVELQRSKLTYFRKCRPQAEFLVLSAYLVVRTLVNALFAYVLCVLTLGLAPRPRRDAGVHGYVLGWHLMGRPASWGLPDKCR